jgi:hypothetical protein
MAGARRKVAGGPVAIGEVSFDTMRHQAFETPAGFIHRSLSRPVVRLCVAPGSLVRADVHITAVLHMA